MSDFNGDTGGGILSRIDRIRAVPQEVLVRGIVIYCILIGLILPNFFAAYLLFKDVFIDQRLDDMAKASFEGLVLGIVFLFAMGLIYGISSGYRRLQMVVPCIAFALVLFSGTFLGEVSNKCIPDGCDAKLYWFSLIVIGIITFGAYILPAVLRFHVWWFGIVYVAVAVWQSELWMMISVDRVGIDPSADNIRGLGLLFFALIWMALFATMYRPERPPQEY